jgi:hypothetical protein
LRLRSFNTSFPAAVDMLALLHPGSLTQLVLDLNIATTNSTAP